MTQTKGGLISRLAYRRILRRWQEAQQAVGQCGTAELMALQQELSQLMRAGRDLEHMISREKVARFSAGDAIDRPLGCDWAWRPQAMIEPVKQPLLSGASSGSLLGDGIKLFHDCPRQEITLCQRRNAGPHSTPFGLQMDVYGFEGSFLSLVVDLPADAVSGFRLHHLVELDLKLEMEQSRPVYCRFNIQHGPNHDHLLSQMPDGGGVVQFDLAYLKLNERRLEKAWIDILFETPAMNKITLRDMTLLRHPRADL